MQDDEFTATPFDAARGILFKYGRVFRNRDRQVDEFEQEVGAKLPGDFLDLIGDYCEGGFDGYYRVYLQNGVEVGWDHLLLMKRADEHDSAKHDTLQIIRRQQTTFFDTRGIARLPFGLAHVITDGKFGHGYLAFDLRDETKIVCLTETPGQRIAIADSFHDMMVGSQFLFFG